MKLNSIQIEEEQRAIKENLAENGKHTVISWISKDYEEFVRGKYWKIAMILLVSILAISGILLNSWTFSLAIVVFTLVYWQIHKSAPQDLTVEISEVGIKVGSKFFTYAMISSFSMDLGPNSQKLLLYLKNDILGERNLNLSNTDPIKVKAYLSNKIPEVEKKNDTFVEILSKFLKI